MTNRVTIKEIAKELGVSVASVSRALNGKGEISAELKKKILEKAKELGYVANYNAISLRNKTTNLIGVLVPDTFNPFFAHFVTKTEEYLYDLGYEILLSTTRESLEKERDYLEIMLSKNVSGILSSPASRSSNYSVYKRLSDMGVPIVFFDRSIRDLNLCQVTTDNRNAVYSAVKTLCENGHKKIAFIESVPETTIGAERLQGYREAMEGLYNNDRIEDLESFLENDLETEVYRILNQKPTALITGNLVITKYLLRILKSLRINIPDDLSLIAFDDSEWLEINVPPITAIRQPIDRMAECSVELLIDRIKNEKKEPQQIELKNELILRDSVTNIGH
ncbi:MAG: LacI family DNA-binding transcriptional regulator [Kosmotogaceae bacterium]